MKIKSFSCVLFLTIWFFAHAADLKNGLSEYPFGAQIVYGSSPLLEHTKLRGEFAGYETVFDEKLPVFINLKPKKGVAPEYPPDDLKKGKEGTLTVNVIVDKDGVVEQSLNTQVKATGKMTQSATVALSEWEFAPITQNGKKVRFIAVVPIVFKLEEKTAAKQPNNLESSVERSRHRTLDEQAREK